MTSPKTERFEMRLDSEMLEALDAWRAQQADLPARAEAIRRLVEKGLGEPENPLRFSSGEILITHMLCEVYEQLKIKGDLNPAFLQSTLSGGHLWGLEWKYPGLYPTREDDSRKVGEVLDILDMWEAIERSFEDLPRAGKQRIESEAAPFGKKPTFHGFDDNKETAYLSIARYLVEDLERFERFGGRNFNSHMPSVDAYRRMLAIYLPMRSTIAGGNLTAPQLIEILKSQIHPSNRK